MTAHDSGARNSSVTRVEHTKSRRCQSPCQSNAYSEHICVPSRPPGCHHTWWSSALGWLRRPLRRRPNNTILHPHSRQTKMSRAATFADGAGTGSPSTLSQRRGSLLSNYSDAHLSSRSSTDNLRRLNGKQAVATSPSTDEPTYWISVPVVAAIVPAVVGLTYENGAAIATDLLILGMAAWFLHWCVSVPW